MIESRETIAVEGGAEEARRAHHRQERTDDLLYQAVRYIPRIHRIGWLHALARYAGRPLTPTPNTAELAYLTWSEQRHTNPRHSDQQPGQTASHNAHKQPTDCASAHFDDTSRKSLTAASTEQAHSTTHDAPTHHQVING